MDPIVIVGGGGHAKVVVSLLKKLRVYRILGYTDAKDNGPILGARFLGPDCSLVTLIEANPGLKGAVGVGQVGLGTDRYTIFERLPLRLAAFPPIVSPAATVNESVTLGEGAVIMDGAVISAGARIGRGAIINSNSTIEHDSNIGDWTHIAPGATICGGVSIGDFSMVGAGATIIEGIRVGPSCMVGAGAVVVRDIDEPGVFCGIPARLLVAKHS